MKKRIRQILSVIAFVCILFTATAVRANGVANIRTVCDRYNSEFEIPYITMDGTWYVPAISVAYLCTGSKSVKTLVYHSLPVPCSVEQVDELTGKASYFTVWDDSTKLRIQGHDEELLHPAKVHYVEGLNDTLAYISVDDFLRIYGYDINYWAEKNTAYLTYRANGLLQKYT